MLPSKTIKFMLAIASLLGITIVVGATVGSGKTTASPPASVTRPILRRENIRKLPATANEILEPQRKAQDKEKRNLKIREFKDMPLKVQAIRNLDSDTWLRDLQIEVKNVGGKPIYSILAYLEFLDEKAPDDGVSAIILRFGERKYIDIRVVGDPDDPHLNPGDSYVFTIEEKYRKGLGSRHERSPELFKHMEFRFNVISFGDSTGFEVGDPTDYRHIKKSSESKKHHAVTGSRFGVLHFRKSSC